MNRRTWLTHSTAAPFAAAFLPQANPPRPGLRAAGATLEHAGKRWRGIGVNWYELFLRGLKSPDHAVPASAFHRLADAGIPCARFNAGGFWPNDWTIFPSDPARWFAILDAVIQNAERAGLGLFPSLFWHYPAVPDLLAEPIDQLASAQSRTGRFLQDYTRAVVERYRNSSAIWGWELGNEWALAADLPNAADSRPAIAPQLGTPSQRSERDQLSSRAMRHAMDLVARTIRALDPHRILITGQALPRPSAWHNRHHHSWNPDTQAQWLHILSADNPDPYDTLSIHLYPHDPSMRPAWAQDTDQLVQTLKTHSDHLGKPLVIGEFGTPRALDQPEAAFEALLTAIHRHQIPLALVWVYDLPSQDKEWNITLDNDRAWQIKQITKYNQSL